MKLKYYIHIQCCAGCAERKINEIIGASEHYTVVRMAGSITLHDKGEGHRVYISGSPSQANDIYHRVMGFNIAGYDTCDGANLRFPKELDFQLKTRVRGQE